jgi:hypothetical protein
MSIKTETLEEFLARGGSINKVPEAERVKQVDVVKKPAVSGISTLMSLEEADLFYGEVRKNSKPKKVKEFNKIDVMALPEALRSKFLNKIKEESYVRNSEEEKEQESGSDDGDSFED